MATLSSLKTYCQRHGWRDQTTAGTTQLTAWINDVLKFLALERRWPYYETPGYLNLTEPYTTGTADLTNGDTSVSGTATVWDVDMVGQEFYTSEDSGRVYMISAVGGGTTLTLESEYLGSTDTALSYSIRYVQYDAPSDWGQEGDFYLQDGSELNYSVMSLGDFHRLRMEERNTTSYPTRIMHHSISGTDCFFVHPAPSAAKQVRYTYWRLPATLSSDTDTADMPDAFRGLLHVALRIRLSVDDGNAAIQAMQGLEYQRMIDRQFHGQHPSKPTPIAVGDDAGGPRIGLNGLGAIFDID